MLHILAEVEKQERAERRRQSTIAYADRLLADSKALDRSIAALQRRIRRALKV